MSTWHTPELNPGPHYIEVKYEPLDHDATWNKIEQFIYAGYTFMITKKFDDFQVSKNDKT